jgi:hypothetical protein
MGVSHVFHRLLTLKRISEHCRPKLNYVTFRIAVHSGRRVHSFPLRSLFLRSRLAYIASASPSGPNVPIHRTHLVIGLHLLKPSRQRDVTAETADRTEVRLSRNLWGGELKAAMRTRADLPLVRCQGNCRSTSARGGPHAAHFIFDTIKKFQSLAI